MKYDLSLPILEIPGFPQSVYVGPSSVLEHKQALASMARFFKKEFKYDSFQYDEFVDDEDCIGVLICERALDQTRYDDHFPSYVVGGCCFLKLNATAHRLDWIWLHPFARNGKKLKGLWPQFKKRFGTISLTPPVSPHMQAFIDKHG